MKVGKYINDFTTMEEVYQFFVMGPMRPANEMPFCKMDGYHHGVELLDLDEADIPIAHKMIKRFKKTFE